LEQTSRSRQSSTGVSAPYRWAISAGVGLGLVAAILAPHDQPDTGRGSIAERHRWAGLGFHDGTKKRPLPRSPHCAFGG
jgi:hypothetical protein